MKIDIVIDFYRKWNEWPLVAWGLRQNLAHINRVIVANDELWSSADDRRLHELAPDLPLYLIDHPHDGFGGHRCTYEGLCEVETEHWMALNADIIMSPDFLEDTLRLAAPRRIVYAQPHDIPADTQIGELDRPRVVREWGYGMACKEFYAKFRDTCVLEHTDSSRELGARKWAAENFPGYGYMDYNNGLRWALKYGLHSVVIGGGVAYQLGGCATYEGTEVKQPHPENIRLFHETLAEFTKRFA